MNEIKQNIDTPVESTEPLRMQLAVGRNALSALTSRVPESYGVEKNLEPDEMLHGEDKFEINRSNATQVISWVRGAENNPQIARRAQEIHGQCYTFGYGYFKHDALTPDGRLYEELDGTREKTDGKMIITYLLAQSKNAHPSRPADSSLRIIDIADGAGIEALPAYGYDENTITPSAKARLSNIIDLYGPQSVREIAALATLNTTDHAGSYELMRAIIQNAVIKSTEGEGSREVWIAALTDISLRPVMKFAGKAATEVIGDPTPIYQGEPRAAENLHVTPVMIDPCKIIDGIVDEIESSESLKQRQSLMDKLHFVTDGLTEEQAGIRAVKIMKALEMRRAS